MMSRSLLAVVAGLVFVVPVSAQEYAGGWSDNTGLSGVDGQQGEARHDSAPTNSRNFYVPVAVPGQTLAPVQRSYVTSRQSLPDLPTVSSGTVKPGTHNAPGSLALMNEVGQGGELPRTVLNSITAEGGFDDMIWGGESTVGAPPYSDWKPIGSRALQHASTGHQDSSLPSIKD